MWSKGLCKELRRRFVYEIDDKLHVGLHEQIGPIHIPNEKAVVALYSTYKKHKNIERELNALEACIWLADHCPDERFKSEMYAQAALLTPP